MSLLTCVYSMKVVNVEVDERTYMMLLRVAEILGIDVKDLVQELVKLGIELAVTGLLIEGQVPRQKHLSN